MNMDIILRLIPIIFVSMQCFIIYAMVKATQQDKTDDEVNKIVSIGLKFGFGGILPLGYSFITGLSAMIPMREKSGGLRHMMHLFGLSSVEYYIGLKIADWIIILYPATVASIICILTFDVIML